MGRNLIPFVTGKEEGGHWAALGKPLHRSKGETETQENGRKWQGGPCFRGGRPSQRSLPNSYAMEVRQER